MKVQRFYLDTSVFIAEFDKKGSDYKLLTTFLNVIKKANNVKLCSSKWALAEMYQKLTRDKIKELKVVKYIKEVLDLQKIRSIPIKILDVSSSKNYSFNEFFNDLGNDLKNYKKGSGPGIGDIIHVRIMKNNKIKHIITFDSDFENIHSFVTINPRKIKKEELEKMKNAQN